VALAGHTGAVRAGEQQRFVAVYERWYPLLLGFATRRVGAPDAPDVVADTFAVAWAKIGELPGDQERELAWLLATAQHLIRTRLRAQGRLHSVEHLFAQESGGEDAEAAPSAGPPSQTPHTAQADQRLAVARLLVRLPPADREVLLLAEWDKVPVSVGAQVMGVTPTTYGVRLHRAHRRIAQLMALHGLLPDAPDVPDVRNVAEEPSGAARHLAEQEAHGET
jgi:RNA polymerase sigma-70 factor (ECF subfamily)